MKVGECTAQIFPLVASIDKAKGAEQVAGGMWAITLEDSYCTGHYQPKLTALPNWNKNPLKAQAAEAEDSKPSEEAS